MVGVMCVYEFDVKYVGDWVIYCYKLYYIMNVMGYLIFIFIGVDKKGVVEKIRKI